MQFYASLRLPSASFCSYTILSTCKSRDMAPTKAVMLPRLDGRITKWGEFREPMLKALELHQGENSFTPRNAQPPFSVAALSHGRGKQASFTQKQ